MKRHSSRYAQLAILLLLGFGAACTLTLEQSFGSEEQTPTETQTEVPPTPTETATSIPTSTVTLTPSPSPTFTPSPTPTASILDSSNVSDLRLFKAVPLDMPPELKTAFWSSGMEHIITWTDEGWQMLDTGELRLIESQEGESPLWFGGDNQLLILDRERDVRFSDSYQTLVRLDPPEWYGYSNANTIAVSPDGSRLAHVSGENGITIVSLTTGERKSLEIQRNFRLEGIDRLVFNQDGSILAVEGYAFDRPVIVVDGTSGEVLYEIANASRPSFSPDGSKLIVRGPNSIEIRNAYTGIYYQRLSSGFIVPYGGPYGTAYNIQDFAFAGDNLTAAALYSSRDNGQLIIWDLSTGNPKQTFSDMPVDIQLFMPSPDGSQLLTSSTDKRLKIWDLETGEVLAQSEPYQVDNSYPALNAAGTLLAIPGIPQVKVIHLGTGETIEIGDYVEASRLSVEMVGNDHLSVEVSTVSWRSYVDIWDLEENRLIKTFKEYRRCSFNTTGSHMVCNSNLQLFEVMSGRLLGSYGPDSNLRYEWALSPDGKQFAVCSIALGEGWVPGTRSDNISVYDTGRNELRRLLTADEKGICSRMAFSPDGQFLVASSGYVWSTKTGSVVSKFESPSEHVTVSIDPSSQMILAGNTLVELATGNLLGQLDSGYGRVPPFFTDDGKFIAVVTDDQVELWGSSK